MEQNSLRLYLGLFLNLEMWTMLGLNIVCLLCVYRGRLYDQKENPVFVITGLNILVETLQLILHVVYVGPSILMGDWFFEGQESLGVTVVATWFLGCWYLGSLNQIAMAINRLFVVCLPNIRLTRNNFLVVFILLTILAAGMVSYSQLISPCCRITPDPRYFGYSYLIFANQTDNPSMKFVDVPLDSLTSIICIVSYIFLFGYIIKMGRNSQDGVRRKEIRLCIQFVIVFFTYTVIWSTFFIFPAFGIRAPEAYITTTVVFMANCGINSVIYLLMNKEIQKEFYKLAGMQKRLKTLKSTQFSVSNAQK